jgi:monofunctional biosynthetic peptidoglycan transglycosylase
MLPPMRRGPGKRLRLALVIAGVPVVAVALFFLTLPSVGSLKTTNPAMTALMEARAEESREHGRVARHTQHWVSLSHVSPWLKRAVVNSEDSRFYGHDGIDYVETEEALTRAIDDGRFSRGASTITQQLAKNLWMGEERTLWRKVREALVARRLESLGKRRVLELYLNVVEWGDGIYGADAAARIWFHEPASALTPEQAAVLAAMLPNPRKRNPHHPSSRLRQRAAEILELYGMHHQLTPDQLADARDRLQALLGSPPIAAAAR